MAEVTNDLIYEVLKSIQERVGALQDGQRAIPEELTALRGHQVAMQRDVYNIHERFDAVERRLERIERRLELVDVQT